MGTALRLLASTLSVTVGSVLGLAGTPLPPDAAAGTSLPPAAAERGRTISWKGYTWTPRSVPGAPGPVGTWAAENAFVDKKGHLHLRITRGRDGQLVQAELDGENKGMGYGTYRWTVASDVSSLHPEQVLGLFTYGQDPGYGHREIDIEAAGWGQSRVDWSYTTWADGHNLVQSTPARPGPTTHEMRWDPGRVTWTTRDATGALLATATTTTGVPVPLDEAVAMNFWVCGCVAGWEDTPPGEVVVTDFRFQRRVSKRGAAPTPRKRLLR